MAKEKAPALPWYGREFYADENVLVMTLEQEGAYFRMLWNCWQEGSIPTDTAKLAALCKNTPVKKFERDIWPALSALFSHGGGRLVHRKVEELRNAKEARRVACSKGGKLGNEMRWGKDRVPDKDATETRPESDHSESLSDFRFPITDYQEPKTCASDDARMLGFLPPIDDPPFGTTEPEALFPSDVKKPAMTVDGLTPQQESWFGVWWAAYWLHKAKKAARRAFGRQVKTAARFEQVMAATEAQTPEMLGREPQHRPHGATWLNGERWGDEAAGPAKQETAIEPKRDAVSNALGVAMKRWKAKNDGREA